MRTHFVRSFSVALLFLGSLTAACAGSSAPPGKGDVIADVGSTRPIGIALVKGDPVLASLSDPPTHVRIARAPASARDATASDVSLGAIDWIDFANGGIFVGDPPKVFKANDTNAFFLGLRGVTIVPLDGVSPGRLLTYPDALVAESFAVDGEDVYLCDGGSLGRFRAGGAWELLAPKKLNDNCFALPMIVDDEAVYWATTHALRRWTKRDGAATTMLDATTLGIVTQLALGGDTLIAAGALIVKVDKRAPSSDAGTTLGVIHGTDPYTFAMVADAHNAYLLSQVELRRVSLDGGPSEVLAHRDVPGAFMGLAIAGEKLYFANYELGGHATIRTVAK